MGIDGVNVRVTIIGRVKLRDRVRVRLTSGDRGTIRVRVVSIRA